MGIPHDEHERGDDEHERGTVRHRARDCPRVVDFEHPAQHLSVHPRTLGGWPVIEGTRVQFDTIARLVDNRTVFVEDIPLFPRVTVEAAAAAVAR